jgi:hypothetical protein
VTRLGACSLAAAIMLAACGGGGTKEVDAIVKLSVADASGAKLVATGYGVAWFAATGVTPVDQRSRKAGHPIYMRDAVNGLAVGEGGVWAALADGTVVRIDPQRRVAGPPARVGPHDLGASETPLAAGEGAVWTAVEDGVVALDPLTRKPRAPIVLDGTAQSIVAAKGSVWVAIGIGTRRSPRKSSLPPEQGTIVPGNQELVADDARSYRVVRIEPRTGRVTADVKVAGVVDLALLGDALWAATDRGVEQLDSRTLAPTKAIKVGDGNPTAIAAGGGAVWGTIARKNLAIRVDPRAGKVTGRWEIPSASGPVSAEIGDLAVGDRAVWIGTVVGPRVGVIDL